MVPLGLYMAIFSLQTVLVLIPHISPGRFLATVLFGLTICGTCGAIATAGIVSTAGLFPSHVGMGPFFAGQAFGGVAVSLANFVAATIEDPTTYYDQHCTSNNSTNHTYFEAFSDTIGIATTRVNYLEAQQRQQQLVEDGPDHSCSPYQNLDWAVFLYFLAGCGVLFLCLVGYHFIHLYKVREFRDDYQVVTDSPLAGNVNGDDNVDEISPRLGLELNGRLQEQQQEKIGIGGGGGEGGHMGYYTDHPAGLSKNAAISVESLNGDELFSASDDALAPPPSGLLLGKTPSSTACIPIVRGGDPCKGSDDHDEDRIVPDEGFQEEYTEEVDEIAVFSAVKGPATCIFLTFTVTLCLFPSWISELRSSHECSHFRLQNDLYVPFSFLFFNVGDLLGRMLAERIPVERIPNLSKKLVVGSLLRLILFPLFLMCLTTPGSASSIVIRSDLFSLMIQFFFAVSNGLLVSTSFMWSPHLVGHTTELKERSSEIMTFAVYGGLLAGSLLAFPFLQLATRILQ